MSTLMPPNDVDAEATVLGESLLRPDSLADALGIILPEHFYLDAHRRVWEAMSALYDTEQTVDVVTVAGWLRDQGRLDQIGGMQFLAALLELPAVSDVTDHALRIVDKWRLRTLIAACRTTGAEAHGSPSADTLISDHQEALDRLVQKKRVNTQHTIRESLRTVVQEREQRRANKDSTPGIPTGLTELDKAIGGLKRGNLYVIAARPGLGKTGFGLSVALSVAGKGFGVIFISLEMPHDQLTIRAIAQEGKLDTRKIETDRLTVEEAGIFASSVERLSHLPIVFDDDAVQTPTSIRSAARRGLKTLRREYPEINLGLIVVDYLQIMTPSATKKNSSREQDVTELSGACMKLAREFNAPVIALSQLNRGVESRPDKRPQLSDLRESGAIEQDAYGVLMLYRDDYYRSATEPSDGRAEILIRKMRQGGATGTVHAMFHAESTSFINLASRDYDFDSLPHWNN